MLAGVRRSGGRFDEIALVLLLIAPVLMAFDLRFGSGRCTLELDREFAHNWLLRWFILLLLRLRLLLLLMFRLLLLLRLASLEQFPAQILK